MIVMWLKKLIFY